MDLIGFAAEWLGATAVLGIAGLTATATGGADRRGNNYQKTDQKRRYASTQ